MTDITTVVDRYFAIWNESDPDLRAELIAGTFTEDAAYAGPMIDGAGHEGIASLADQLLEHLGGHQFNRTGEIDAHHGAVRYAWEIVPAPGQPPLAAGVDFGIVGTDGRFQSVTTFLDLVPEGAGER
jgi:hypothetical protein